MTTVSDPQIGKKIAEGLLEKQLAACVQSLDIQSRYRWKGSLHQDAEVLLLIKTKTSLYPDVEAFICAMHDYEVPEIILVPMTAGLPAYLNWIESETRVP